MAGRKSDDKTNHKEKRKTGVIVKFDFLFLKITIKTSMKKTTSKSYNNSDKKIDLILREIIRIEREMEFGFACMNKDFNQLQGAVDAYAKKQIRISRK